jgi:hypothetical protein
MGKGGLYRNREVIENSYEYATPWKIGASRPSL